MSKLRVTELLGIVYNSHAYCAKKDRLVLQEDFLDWAYGCEL